MMHDEKLSIGIVVFHEDRSTDFAISSAKAQSDICNEIIISDNNVNRSHDVIKRWNQDLRVKYINSGCNIGMFQNFVRAYDNSTNRYFCWLSDDDFIHPKLSETIALEIARNSDDVVAWTGLSTVHTNDYCSRLSGRIFPSFISDKRIERLRDVAYLGQWGYPFYSIIDKNKISIETLRRFCDWPAPVEGLDWAWIYSLALRGKIKVLPQQMYYYNLENWAVNGSGVSGQRKKFANAIRKEFHINEELIEELTKLNRCLLYLSYTFSDYIDFVNSNNAAYSAKDVNDLINLWCYDIVNKLFRMTPLNLVSSEKYHHFLKSQNLRDFIFNLADFYDQYLINPLVGEFVRKIFSSELCEDQMKIMNTPLKKIKSKSFSIRDIQIKKLKLLMYFLKSMLCDKVILLPRISK